jgi:uncharacterized protein YjbI with pentapeptide repeats
VSWWIVAVTGVVVIVATALLWWWVPKWQADRLKLIIRDPKARADLEDNFRKTMGQLLGGAAVLIGTGFAYYQSQLVQKATSDQLQATYVQITSQQVSKGFEQLGSKNIVLRLGGIYALEGVMNTSEQYHQPVLEALCAFVRDANFKIKEKSLPSLPTDIQAALTVIARRKQGLGRVDLSDARLFGAALLDADLSRANLTGTTLTGAHLTGATLTGAHLSHADLGGAHLSRAHLTDANLSHAGLLGTDLLLADLSGAHLTGADLSYADLSRANLTGADLTGAHMSGAHLIGANLTGANLTGADLSGATDLTQSQLFNACGDKETKLPNDRTIKPCSP